MEFRIVGPITEVETIASGHEIRELRRLRRSYGGTRWRKRKGLATVHFEDGSARMAEIHWYEAHGFGQKELKIKRLR